jgi:hypothetical protein
VPIDYSRYPATWRTVIRPAIIARATGPDGIARCEWCGVPNGEVVDRHPDGRWVLDDDLDGWNSDVAIHDGWDDDGVRIVRIVLTVAHLGTAYPDGTPGDKHDKHDCRPENLAALCQSCHLGYDRADHVRHAAETRRQKQIERGQLALAGLAAGGGTEQRT